MGLLDRVSQLMTSDIGHLLARAENPLIAVEQLVGDLEETIVELRRETVAAVARQNRVRKRLFAAEDAAGRVEQEASLALACGEELRARHVLSRKIATLKARDALEVELAEAGRVSAGLVATLIRVEDRAQVARRTHDALVRRRRTTRAEPGGQGSGLADATRAPRAAEDGGHAFDGYAEAVTALEREASRASGEGVEGGGGC